ncbi:MAG: two-component regulator propeller domain-containing protein [Permianibacter sp.]
MSLQRLFTLAWFCLWQGALPATAAEPPVLRFRQLGMADGLSQSTVMAVAQDRTGFIWFGTRDGLARYDGRQLRLFREPVGGLQGQTINELLLDRAGQLWVGSNAGLFRYRPDREQFEFVPLADDRHQSATYNVFCLLQDQAGRLWMGNRQGLWQYQPETGRLALAAVAQGEAVHALAESRPGELWLALPEALGRFQPDDPHYQTVPVSSAAGAGERRALLATDSGSLWLAGWQPGLLQLDLDRLQLRPVALGDSAAARDFGLSLTRDPTGALWLGTRYSGLLRYDPKRGHSQSYRTRPGQHDSLSGDSVVSLFIDREALLWAGTEGDGVSFARVAGARFRHYGQLSHGLDDDNIRAVLEDRKHRLWLGTPTGLYQVDPGTDGKARHHPLPAVGPVASRTEAGPADMVHALAPHRRGGFWVGSEKGLFRYDPEKNRLLPMRQQLQALPATHQNSIINVLEGHDGAVWLGTYGGGLFRWQPDTNQLHALDASRGSRGQLIYALFADRRGRIWAGHENGVERWSADAGQPLVIGVASETTAGLGYSVVQAIAEDYRGRLWVGTQRGLDRLSFDADDSLTEVRHYDERDGLTNTMIWGLLTSNDGRKLWLSSNSGLAELDVDTDQLRQFDQRDGLQGNEFNGGSVFRNERGELFFGGVNGLNVFQPAELTPDPQPPTVVFTGLRRFDQPVPLQPALAAREHLQFDYRDSVLGFELAALHFADAAKTRFAYRLDGLDPDWVELGNANRFTLRNLPWGDYRLQARAANGDGVWSEPVSLSLSISPPWWRSHWAYAGYAASLVAVMLLLLAWRTRDLRVRAIELERTVNDRTQQIEQQKQVLTEQAERMQELLRLRELLFANISHEFRTPLTLILGPTEQLLGQCGDPASQAWLLTIQRNAQRLLRMVEQLIQLARLQAGANPPPEWQPISAQASAIAESFQHLARSKGLRFNAAIEPGLCWSGLADAGEQILLNLLSNACKYTANGGEVSLTVAEHAGQLQLSVRDTGIGIDPSQQGQLFQRFYRAETAPTETIPGAGLGLALVKELVDSHGGMLFLDSQPGVGTHIKIELPGCCRQSDCGDIRSAHEVLWPDLATTAAPVALPAGDNRPSLLIIEDNGELRRYLVQLLGRDYHCLEAADGDAGLQLAQDWVPDLILCDVALPGRDGFVLARLIKEDERCCHIPFVFLTAHADPDSRLRGLRELADDYLAKPFDAAELRQRLANLLELRTLLRQRYGQQLLTAAIGSQRGPTASPPLTTCEPAISDKDQRLLARLQTFLSQHHGDSELDLQRMAAALAMSERQLQRKLQALLNLSPLEYLKLFRLERAATLLQTGLPPGRVAEAVGFVSAAHFSRCFKARYGVAPGQFRR